MLLSTKSNGLLWLLNLYFSQNKSKEGHSNIHAIFHLSEVGCSGVGINLCADFINTRQRVQYYHIIWNIIQEFFIDYIGTLNKAQTRQNNGTSDC